MGKFIEIQEDEVDSLRLFYQQQLQSLLAERIAIDKKEETIRGMLEKLATPQSIKPNPLLANLNGGFKGLAESVRKQINASLKPYNLKDTIINKIRYVLEESDKPMTTYQINLRLLDLDETYRVDSKRSAKNVSSVLSVNHGVDKPFLRSTDENGNFIFTINK